MVCRYTFTGPSGNEITLEGIPALKAYLATGGLDYLLPDRAPAETVSTDASAADEAIRFSPRRKPAPENTVTAYKLFRIDKNKPGQLFPLFVNANDPVPMNEWLDADEGPMQGGKVKSKLGPLAYRPGWHAGDLPLATHIGGKSSNELKAPDIRPDNQVWAEVEMAADKDWQSVAEQRARRNKAGDIIANTAHITDQIPEDGFYRYKTNANMTGNWLIGGSMKVTRILSDAEVKQINAKAGTADLPRAKPQDLTVYGFKASTARAQTETPEFKQWFDNSKVVDENGEPLVVYHITKENFSVFHPGGKEVLEGHPEGLSGTAMWFGSNKAYQPAMHNVGGSKKGEFQEGTNVMPVFLKMKRPLILDDKNMVEWAQEVFAGGSTDFPQIMLTKWKDNIAAEGYDGVIFRDDPLGWGSTEDEYIVFEPTQIKSAIGNVGTFDATQPSILLSPPRFYSQLERTVADVPERLQTQPAAQWKAWLASNASKFGIKKDELEWSGVYDYLDMRGKEKVTAEELSSYLDLNNVKIQEVTKGGAAQIDYSEIEELPTPSPLQVVENDDDRLPQYKYAVKTVMDGRYIGYGNTEQDALSDAYSGYPEYWEEMNKPEGTKYSQWTLPGGGNYREMLLTLPAKLKEGATVEQTKSGKWRVTFKSGDTALFGTESEARAEGSNTEAYRSSHWDEANILAHIRMNDRTDANGDKVLFIEEMQSDWAQAGRKGGFRTTQPALESAASKAYDAYVETLKDKYVDWYAKEFADEILDQAKRREIAGVEANNMSHVNIARAIGEEKTYWQYSDARADERGRNVEIRVQAETGVPNAPFLKNTKDWVALATKRVLLLAAQEGYDKVAFVNGDQSADRYNLAKQVREITYEKQGGEYYLSATDLNGNSQLGQTFSEDKLEDVVGKEIAQKIVNGEGTRAEFQPASRDLKTLSGVDLAVGGEGMKSFYNRIVPQVVGDVLKKLGGKMDTVDLVNPNADRDLVVAPIPDTSQYGVYDRNTGRWMTNYEDETFESSDPEDAEPMSDGAAKSLVRMMVKESGVAAMQQPGFTVTPEMREKLKGEGLPLFSRTRTPAFQDWFGDSVLTKNGEPQVLYHGTADVVNAFDLDHPNRKDTGWLGTGVYLTDDPELASAYAGQKARSIKPRGQNVMSLYARLENPYMATADEKDAMRNGGRAAADQFTKDLQSQGYDGVILELGNGAREIVVFDPTAVKSATGNAGTYSRETTDIRYSNRRAFGDLTPEQEASLAKVGAMAQRKTLRQRMLDLKETFQKSWQQGIFDQFAPLKNLSQEAYMLARLSKGSDGTMEAAMLYGKPFIGADGVPDVDINDKGFAKTLASLKGEHDRFLWWVAAQRAGLLKQQGLENLFDWGDISNLVDLNQGSFADGTPRAPVYAQAFREMSEFNDAVLKVAKDSGLIDQKAVDLFKGTPYVPFYRVMDGDQMRAGKFSSGLVNQTAWKKLKGGKEQLNSDLLANVLLNWSHLYTASANNRAAVASMQAASDMQIAHEVPASAKKSVKVMVNGEAYHYVIDDPYVMEAVTALEYVSPSFFKPFSIMKRWLTTAVTADPAFKVKNLIRDSISAISQSDLSTNPFANVKQGLAATSKEGQTYASMLAGGGLIRFGSMVEGDRAHHARRLVEKEGGVLLDKKGWDKLSSQFMSMLSAYNELGDRMENVNRAALYEQLIAKGHSKAEANFMARDLMDFSMSGRWPVIRFLSQTVPFMNARLQGLYKLGRAANENPKRFGYVVGAVALASIALMLAYEDDEDWKKRPDWDRDANWWFKIGDTAFRIPKPFEVGAIGTLAERTWELFFNNEMTGRRYRERISNMIFDTFAMDPTPQIVKPLLDVYSNKVGFTGRPIETMGQQKLRPEDRVNASTSQVAKFLGQLGLPDPAQLAKGEYKALSPVQVDYLIRGYFGWLGTSATTVLDYGIRPMLDQGERPDMRLKDVFFVGKFAEKLPSSSSRYVDQMYQQATEIEQAYASWREAIKSGDTEKAKEIFEDEREKIVKYKMANKVTDRVGDISRQIKQIQASKSLSGETKRRMIDQLEQQKDLAARALR